MAERIAGALFKSFHECSRIEDPDERREQMLLRLEHVWSVAMGRARTIKGVKGGDPIQVDDPDCNAAVKVVEVACELLSVKPVTPGAAGNLLGSFERPKLREVKGTT